jgi:type IV pilus assembly protein PilA
MSDGRTDEGFTLLELMVVVLVIAVLLAIAVPSYLGARSRASDRATQSNLRTAHVNELAWASDNQSAPFTADVDELLRQDASLDWTATRADLEGRLHSIYVYLDVVGTQPAVVVASKSRPGTCFWLRAVANESHPRFATDDCSGTALDFRSSW